MPDLTISVKIDGSKSKGVPATFWSNGPRVGTYWYTIRVGDRNRLILVKGERSKATGAVEWYPAPD